MPKFVEVPVFAFSELSEKAQDKAHADYLSYGFDFDEADNMGTIKSFCDLFDIELQNWSIDSCHYSYDITIPNQRNITKKAAIAIASKWEISQGYCLAYSATQAMLDANNWRYGDLRYVLDQGIDNMFRAWQRDLEYYESVEYFAELCDCNEWQFLESGEVFHG